MLNLLAYKVTSGLWKGVQGRWSKWRNKNISLVSGLGRLVSAGTRLVI